MERLDGLTHCRSPLPVTRRHNADQDALHHDHQHERDDDNFQAIRNELSVQESD